MAAGTLRSISPGRLHSAGYSGRHKKGNSYGLDGEPGVKAKSYVGWYYHTPPDIFEWQPKSYYLQINSGKSRAEKAIEEGCSYVVVVEFEPFMLLPQPSEFGYYIQNGFTYGESTIFSLPVFLWSANFFGDPLTRRE